MKTLEQTAKREEGALNLILIGSIIGIVAALTDLVYHISRGEIEEVLGSVPLERITHPFPIVIYPVFILIYLWQRSRK